MFKLIAVSADGFVISDFLNKTAFMQEVSANELIKDRHLIVASIVTFPFSRDRPPKSQDETRSMCDKEAHFTQKFLDTLDI